MGTLALQAQMALSDRLADSTMLPMQYRKNPANLLWAVQYAESIGVPPMTAITSIHVIEGKPTASADLIAGLVRRAGHKLRVWGDDQSATAQVIRADDPDFDGFRVVWTLDRAKAAGLTGKGTWRAYPAAMLRARAITEVARMACSEALHGVIYTPEELGAEVDADGDVVDVTPKPTLSPPAAPVVPSTPKGAAVAAAVAAKAEAPGWRDDADRRWFMAEIGNRGLDYETELAPWCESVGRPRPSAMTPGQRKLLLDAIADPGKGAGLRLKAWVADKRAKEPAPAVDAVPDDDTPFFDEDDNG
ncbi:MAG: hypothetical protein FJ100_21900 [Deltaproteobacteria bacterium]|nr:hypothetical protein [Deltaproteobacteria bacterium]